ncbi:MAG: HNH endonuclease signature motif containing protein [Pseudomonadota bacterium]
MPLEKHGPGRLRAAWLGRAERALNALSVSPTPPDTPLFHTLWARQNGRCALCGAPMPKHRFEVAHATIWKRERPSFDHIRPRGAGGTDEPSNLQLAHYRCNVRKGRRV